MNFKMKLLLKTSQAQFPIFRYFFYFQFSIIHSIRWKTMFNTDIVLRILVVGTDKRGIIITSRKKATISGYYN